MNMIWRVRDRKMDFPAMPMDWKKLVATTWKPTIQNAMVVILRQLTAQFI